MRRGDLRDIIPLAAKAMQGGATVTRLGNVQWDVRGRCTAPIRVYPWGRTVQAVSLVQ